MRAANSSRNETQAIGEVPTEEQEQEEEDEDEEETAGQGEVEGDAGIPVEEAVTHHNLVPVVVASATAGDFFQFTNEQQWIT